MKKLTIIVGILSLTLIMLLNTVDGFAQRPGNRPGKDPNFRGQRHGAFWSELTEEQRTAIQEKIKGLRDQGVSREEIHAAVKDMLLDWGIELPENREDRPGLRRFGHRPDRVFSQLTEEQRNSVDNKIKELKEQKASPNDIHAAVKDMLQGWGIALPEDWEGRPNFRQLGHRPDNVFSQLTTEQRKAVHQKAKELKEQGGTREEIQKAVKNMLEGYGIELPEDWGERGGFPLMHHRDEGVFSQLTEDQRKELHEKIKTLREQDASHEDIKTATKNLLESWDIELPENWDEMPGFRPFRRGRMGFMDQLTAEQRKQVHDKIKELREQEANREEIRAVIKELLKEFGIDPKNPDHEEESQSNLNQDMKKSMLKATNHPNPFNPETNISYTLQDAEHVQVSIYNVQGQLIRTLVDETQPAGSYTVRWDGFQENGEKAVSGMYLYRIGAGKQTLTRKMILMK